MSLRAQEIPGRTPLDQSQMGRALSLYRQFTRCAYEQVAHLGHGIELLVGGVGNDSRDTYGKFDTVPDSACLSESPNPDSTLTGTTVWRSFWDRPNLRRGAAIISSPDHGARWYPPCEFPAESELAPTSTFTGQSDHDGAGKTREAGAPTPTSNHLALAKCQCLGSSSPAMMSERSPNR